MGSISDFLNNMDWWGLLTLLISAAAALLCITLHELSHGFVAWRLGDPTAKNAGRLTLNPIRHLDVVGLLMMLVAKVGWAKPVPVAITSPGSRVMEAVMKEMSARTPVMSCSVLPCCAT